MKNWLIKHFGLSYDTKVFGQHFRVPRATMWIVPLFMLAIGFTISREPEDMGGLWLLWVPFILTILLGFPIIKSKAINYTAIGMFILVLVFENIWVALPLLFFIVGIFFDRSRFLFFSIKYGDLRDWEQQWQYLNRPRVVAMANADETEPVGEERTRIYNERKEMFDEKYNGPEKFVEPFRFFWPFGVTLLLIIFLIIFGSNDPSFPEVRGF